MKIRQDLPEPSTSVKLRTPAKINLTLAVLGKRPDGFHEIESVVMPVGLYDHLALSDGPEAGIHLSCDNPALPTGPENLVYRAAERLAERHGRHRGVQIELTKRIPAGAGLGGGSSDAAATLVGLDRLWRLGLARSELTELAADLGSDVPLFLHPGPAIIGGRGERVEPVELDWPGWIVLVIPPFGMSTAEVYRGWQAGEAPPQSASEVVQAVRDGQPLDGLLYNMLEPPAFAVEPQLGALHAELLALGAPAARLTGSGAALFALFDACNAATAFAEQASRQLGLETHVVRTIECEHP